MGYINNSLQKFKSDALSKAVYDAIRYLLILLIGLVIALVIPDKFSLRAFLKTEFKVYLYGIFIYSIILIITAFLLIRLVYLKKYKALEKDNFTDEITGLKNHKALKAHLSKTIDELLYTSKIETLSIIIFDIDNFKEYNTKYGHTKADKILKSLGHLLHNDKRGTDETFRLFKGDEYIVIAKNTCLSDAVTAANRKRESIADNTFIIDEISIYLSVSCGVTEFKKEDDTIDTFLNRASLALMSAKEIKGKNSTKSNY
ncbi:GGDEF domain-containing protein [Flavobacterium sp. SM2513]|uniref:GGDEF domain-containing protein n=1 Tax=Flavobacterium sp. SM2513 TaxID=3424766 RepID=UPI003D7F82C4